LAVAARREEGEYPSWIFDRRATPLPLPKIGNPLGEDLAGEGRRCSSVTERFGYAPSSRLALRPSDLRATISYL